MSHSCEEPAPVGGRRGAEVFSELLPQGRRGLPSDGLGNLVHALVGLLQAPEQSFAPLICALPRP